MFDRLRKTDWPAVVGLIRIPDDFEASICRRVRIKLDTLEIRGKSREAAEKEIIQAARQEIAIVFREAYPGRNYALKPRWPQAEAILADDGDVMVRLWIGHDYSDSGNGVSPIRTSVKWRLGA